MFSIRIRNTALALAGASLFAATLVSSVAEAAQLPGGLPLGDVRISKVERVVDTSSRHIKYGFKVRNHGPDAVKVRLARYCGVKDASGNEVGTEQVDELTLAMSEQHFVILRCFWPEGGYTYYGSVMATMVGSVDSNLDNNHGYYVESVQ